jgi:hypothetical protein
VLIPQDEGHTIVRNVGGYSTNDSGLPINVLQIALTEFNAVTNTLVTEMLDVKPPAYYLHHMTNVFTMADFSIT